MRVTANYLGVTDPGTVADTAPPSSLGCSGSGPPPGFRGLPDSVPAQGAAAW